MAVLVPVFVSTHPRIPPRFDTSSGIGDSVHSASASRRARFRSNRRVNCALPIPIAAAIISWAMLYPTCHSTGRLLALSLGLPLGAAASRLFAPLFANFVALPDPCKIVIINNPPRLVRPIPDDVVSLQRAKSLQDSAIDRPIVVLVAIEPFVSELLAKPWNEAPLVASISPACGDLIHQPLGNFLRSAHVHIMAETCSCRVWSSESTLNGLACAKAEDSAEPLEQSRLGGLPPTSHRDGRITL